VPARPDDQITRRALLGGGLAAWAALAGEGAWRSPLAAASPLAGARSLGGAGSGAWAVESFLVAAPRQRGAATAAGSWAVGAPIRATRPFDLVGLAAGSAEARKLELRVVGPRGWSRWARLLAAHHHPDGASAPSAGEPLWTGRAQVLQLRWQGSAPALRLHCVAVDGRGPALLPQASAATAAPLIAPRAAWHAALARPRRPPAYGAVRFAVVHHTQSLNRYSPGEVPAMILAIAQFHIDGNGWNDIGYNFLVDRFGRAWEGRAGGLDLPVIGAHAGGFNGISTGVAMLGNFMGERVVGGAFRTLRDLLAWKLAVHGVLVRRRVTVLSGGGRFTAFARGQRVTVARVCGHRDVDQTDCPGNALYGELAALRAGVAARQRQLRPRRLTIAATPLAGAVQLGGVYMLLSGAPIVGATVLVERLTHGRAVALATALSDASGAWTATAAAQPGDLLRAVTPSPGSRARASSPLVAVA